MYTYTDKFKLSQERDPYLLEWLYANSNLSFFDCPDKDFLDILDKHYHVDYILQDESVNKLIGISARTINIESHIHYNHGYGFHLRMKDLNTNAPKEFFKNTQKFTKEQFKAKTGLDALLFVQGFFRHYMDKPPELIGAAVVEVNVLIELVREGSHIPYIMGQSSTRPMVFTFVPFFEVFPRISNCVFYFKDLSTAVYVKSKNVLKLRE